MTPGRSALGSCQKMSHDEVLGAVARKAFPKNLILLLPVQDHKDEGSGDLLVWSLAVAEQQ
jgi:hypothetical protein